MSDNDLIQKGQDDLIRRGDAKARFGERGLAFVRSGLDAIPAVHPTVSPDVVALVEAAEKVRDSYWYSSDGIITGMHDLETAIARVKGDAK